MLVLMSRLVVVVVLVESRRGAAMRNELGREKERRNERRGGEG